MTGTAIKTRRQVSERRAGSDLLTQYLQAFNALQETWLDYLNQYEGSDGQRFYGRLLRERRRAAHNLNMRLLAWCDWDRTAWLRLKGRSGQHSAFLRQLHTRIEELDVEPDDGADGVERREAWA